MGAMVKIVTKGVTISVESFFQQEYSNPLERTYRFVYRTKIKNNNSFPIRLLTRKCYIINSHSAQCEKGQGKGVGDIQPTILPGDTYSYASNTGLHTGIGKMHGTFLMENQKDQNTFEVTIPEFLFITPLKMN